MITILFAYRNRDIERIEILMDSLLKQTNKNFEVIFINYGSCLNYSQAVESLLKSYPFVKYYYVGHIGLLWNKSKAFNFGIKNSKAPYILTADIDLIFHPETIEVITNIASSSTFTLFSYGYLPKTTNTCDIKDKSFHKLVPTHFGEVNGLGLYSRKALEEIHGFDEFYHFYGSEDVDLFMRLKNAGYEQTREEKQLFLHQWHPRYPNNLEHKFSTVPRLKNVLRINQKHFLWVSNFNIIVPHNQLKWGECFARKDLHILRNPSLILEVSNKKSSVTHFLNEELEMWKGEILAVNFVEDPNYDSFKFKIKNLIGLIEEPYLKMSVVSDAILEKIVFKYRNHNYLFSISENLRKISFVIDLT
jgi:glycosyltransferase involved in cell wall biosynthesis